jgi:hypothetical protein
VKNKLTDKQADKGESIVSHSFLPPPDGSPPKYMKNLLTSPPSIDIFIYKKTGKFVFQEKKPYLVDQFVF